MNKKVSKTKHLKKTITQSRFLAVYEEEGTIVGAAKVAKIDRNNHYQWMHEDPTYPERFTVSQEAAIQALEKIARERAKAKSDLLLIFLLKSLRPMVYRERKEIEHTGSIDVNHKTMERYIDVRRQAEKELANDSSNRIKDFN